MLTAMIDDMGDPSFYADWGFWFFLLQAVAVALTAFIPVLPSEIMVIASGVMASEGTFPLWLVLTVTFVGCLCGDVGLYAAFRYRLIRVLYRWRWGRRLHRGLLRLAVRAGGTRTWFGLFLVQWVPGGRATAMATAGMMRMGWPALLGLALIEATTWTLWLVGLGYITGTTTGLPPWASILTAVVMGTLVGLFIAMIVARSRRREPHRSAEGA